MFLRILSRVSSRWFNISIPSVFVTRRVVRTSQSGDAFLNLGADGAVIYQVPILDDFRSMIDRDLRILELPWAVEMSYAEFGNLGRGSRHRCLVTLAAGLGVVERAESIGAMCSTSSKNFWSALRGQDRKIRCSGRRIR